jgi:hypothetical protein
MKALDYISRTLFIVLLSTGLMSNAYAQDSKNEKEAKKEAEIKSLIDSQHYVFKAEHAYPLGGRSRALTYDYDLRITKETIVCYLPYYGRAYSAAPGESTGMDFTSKEFEYSVKENKKGGWDIVIKPKDTKAARELNLSAFKNGSANLQINSNDKQSISYSGYITAIESKK